MKTILVDAVNTFVIEGKGIFEPMHNLLEQYPNRKIILTGADDGQMKMFGLDNMPYEVFTLKHNPEKTDPKYYEKMLEHFNLDAKDVIYFEHNEEAVKSARSVGINTYHYNKDTKDIVNLEKFVDDNIYLYFFMDETGNIGGNEPLISAGVAVINREDINNIGNKYLTRGKEEFPEIIYENTLHFTDIYNEGVQKESLKYNKFLIDTISELSKEKIKIFYHIDKKDIVTDSKKTYAKKKAPVGYLVSELLEEQWGLLNNIDGIKIFCDYGYYQEYKESLTRSIAYRNISGPNNNPTLTIKVPHGVNPKYIHNEDFEMPDGNFIIDTKVIDKSDPGLMMADFVCGALRKKLLDNDPSFMEPLKNKVLHPTL